MEKVLELNGLDAEASRNTAVAPLLSSPEDISKTLETSRALMTPSSFVSAETFCLLVGELLRPEEISKTSETQNTKRFFFESIASN